MDEELEQHRQVVCRPARRGQITRQGRLLQIEIFDESIHCTDRIVFGDLLVVQVLGQHVFHLRPQ